MGSNSNPSCCGNSGGVGNVSKTNGRIDRVIRVAFAIAILMAAFLVVIAVARAMSSAGDSRLGGWGANGFNVRAKHEQAKKRILGSCVLFLGRSEPIYIYI